MKHILSILLLSITAQAAPAGDIQLRNEKVTGIGHEEGVCRRDPSDVIKVGERYYVWYSRLIKGQPLYPEGYHATVWYAVSEDAGHNWVEKGEAVGKGKAGEFDSTGTFTPNILAWSGKYYLYYTAVGDGFTNRGYSDKERTVIGLAVADSPDGPWTKLPKPILESTRDPKFFDSFRTDDACLRVAEGKIWLYYKGRKWQSTPGITHMGIARADRPEGPYTRLNDGQPVQTGGHEVQIWEQDGGVYSMVAPAPPRANTLRFSPTGSEFDASVVGQFIPHSPWAPGLYRPELTGDKVMSRERWGIAMAGPSLGDPCLTRYEFTLPSQTPDVALAKPTPVQAAWQDLDFGVLICIEPRVFNGDGNYANAAKVRADPAAYAERFKPAKLDTDQWVATAKALGVNHAILLVKQDTGFCLWPSKANPYSLKSISWRDGKADILRDFVASCKKYGIAPGIFTEARWDKRLGVADFKVGAKPPVTQAEYDRLLEQELEELCTGYGELCEVWYDVGAGPMSARLAAIAEKHQPRMAFYTMQDPKVRSDYRWGGGPEDGMVRYPCWATVNRDQPLTDQLRLSGDPDGKDWFPARADVPLRCEKGIHHWYWHPGGEKGVASLEHLKNVYYGSVGRNAKLIIGLTPDRDGLIPAPDAARCEEFGDWLQQTFGGKPLAETSGKGAKLTLDLPADVKSPVGHIILQENILMGERVRQFVVEEALADGSWSQLCAGTCIGHKFIARVHSDARKFRLRITESVGEPQIRAFTLRAAAGTENKPAVKPAATVPEHLKNDAALYQKSPMAASSKWFSEAKFGMMVHYGLTSVPGVHSFHQWEKKIPVAEYEQLVPGFTAEKFDAEAIAALAVAANMKYITFVAKHCDGFCLWDTKYTEFNSARSPARRDFVAELAEACRKRGLGLFIFYEHGFEWHHPHGPRRQDFNTPLVEVQYPKPEPTYAHGKDYNLDKYLDFASDQIIELMSKYGPVAGVWLDGVAVPLSAKDPKVFRCQELYDRIHQRQPHALISYKHGVTGTEDFKAPEAFQLQHIKPGQETKPVELCEALNPSWSYVKGEKHRGADWVWNRLAFCRGREMNYLLCVGLLPDGSIPPEDAKTLQEIGRRLKEEGWPKGAQKLEGPIEVPKAF